MIDSDRARLVEAPTCPLLGLPDDPVTRFSFPSEAHRCRATDRPRSIELDHQAAFCLGGNYPACARYQAVAAPGRSSAPQPASAPAATRGAGPVPATKAASAAEPVPARSPRSGRWRRAVVVIVVAVVLAVAAYLAGPVVVDWLRQAGVGTVTASPAASIVVLATRDAGRPATTAASTVSPGSSRTRTSRPSPTPTPRVHVVVAGETLTAIAARYGVTVNAVADANSITNARLIYVGERFVIPSP
jgi:LysM repeat protein